MTPKTLETPAAIPHAVHTCRGHAGRLHRRSHTRLRRRPFISLSRPARHPDYPGPHESRSYPCANHVTAHSATPPPGTRRRTRRAGRSTGPTNARWLRLACC
jgi:hypothetical protein